MRASFVAFSLATVLCLTAAAEPGARYLIVAPDSFVSAVMPLAQWKTAKGVLAKVVPLSVAGTTPEAIRTYIRDAWNNWPVRPEYVLICGGPAQIGFPGSYYDVRYGDMTGDYKMELAVGRFWLRTVRECSTIVAKTLAYERPSLDDTAWFLSGLTVVREDVHPDDSIYWNDSRICLQYWRQHGYINIDSFSRTLGDSSHDVDRVANRGTAFITYRGQCGGNWWAPFDRMDPYTWTNRGRLPIVVAGTCASVLTEPDWSWFSDKLIRAISPSALGGGIAYFGTTSISNAIRQRSRCMRAFFRALYEEGEHDLGKVTLRARRCVDSLFPGQQERYEEWTLLGDPELGVWTAVPRRLAVAHDSVISTGPQDFNVTVLSGGVPVEGAVVCLSMDSTVQVYSRTNSAGQVVLHIEPVHSGLMSVVASGRNLLPYQGTCIVAPTAVTETEVHHPVRVGFDMPATVTRSTSLRLTLSSAGRVEVAVYDVQGRRVAAGGGFCCSGSNELPVQIDRPSPGIYFMRLAIDGREYARRRFQLVR